MSCDFEHKRLGSDIERFRRLAKALARMSGETAVIYKNTDGTYGFASVSSHTDKQIVEYISQY